MGRYIIKRVISAFITIWFIMTLTFVLMNSIPGDPFTSERQQSEEIKQAIYAKYGLDQPLHIQYIKYLNGYLHGDFGISFQKLGVHVNDLIKDGFPYSLRIGAWASLFIIVVGVILGIIAALKQNRFTDRAIMGISTLGVTIPNFVLATGFLYIFSKKLGWVPSFGTDTWQGFIGPVVAISGFSLAFISRLTRTSVIEVLQQDYIRTARAKGLSEFVVIFKHALRNGLIPVVTFIGPMIAAIVTGSFVVEKVFAIPGMGKFFVASINNRDYTMIMGITVFYSIFVVIAILLVDIVYVFIDPRIKYD